MNDRAGLLLSASLLMLAAFMLYRNRAEIAQGGAALVDSGESLINEGVEYMVKLTRGERNNNPGNIVKSDIFWRGEIAGDDKRFESFASPDEGIRALAVILQNYQKKYGLNTVRGIINRYAPPTVNGKFENDTGAYINAVSGALGVSPDAALNLANPAVLLPLVTAIIKHENGRVLYDQALIASAVGVA